MFRTILIDDEKDALDTLETDLKKYCSEDVDIIGKFSSPGGGLKAIRKLRPELVFLDVRMPEIDGFEILEILKDIDFHIIFVSGFNEYALKAFRVSAIDFLAKPVGKNELLDSIEKVKQRASLTPGREFKVLLENLSQIQTITIKSQREYRFFELTEIMYCKADGNFSYLFMTSQPPKQHTSYPIGKMSELLPDKVFFRIHASYIISRLHLKRYIKGAGAHVVMKNGVELPVARSRREEFDAWLGFGNR